MKGTWIVLAQPCLIYYDFLSGTQTFGNLFRSQDLKHITVSHNKCDGISNHWRLHCLHNCLFRRRSKKASKLHITGLCEGNSLVASAFTSQKASNECTCQRVRALNPGSNRWVSKSWLIDKDIVPRHTRCGSITRVNLTHLNCNNNSKNNSKQQGKSNNIG